MKWKRALSKPRIIKYREVEGMNEDCKTGHGYVTAWADRDFIIKDELGEYPINKKMFHKNYEDITYG